MRNFLLLLLLASASAKAEHTVTYGLEMEFSSKTFANFIHYFDMDDLQKRAEGNVVVPESVFDDYLRNPEAFEALPLELKMKLTEGRVAPRIELEKPEAKGLLPQREATTKSKILGLDGEPFSAELRPAPALEIPKNAEATAFAAKVQKAWKDLPIEEKRKVARFKYFPRLEQARIAIVLEFGSRDPGSPDLRLRRDVPVEIKTFFEKLHWHRDQDGMEFKYVVPTTDQRQYREDVRFLARLAGVESYLDRPLEKPLGLFTYHNNLGRMEGESHLPVADALRTIISLRMIAAGRSVKELQQVDVLRPKAKRLEIREHVDPFDVETQEAADLLRQDDFTARRAWSEKILSHLDSEATFDFALRSSTKFLLTTFARREGTSGDDRLTLRDPRLRRWALARVEDCIEQKGTISETYWALLQFLMKLEPIPDPVAQELLREVSNAFQQGMAPERIRKTTRAGGGEDMMSLLDLTYRTADQSKSRIRGASEEYFAMMLEFFSSEPGFAFSYFQYHLKNPFARSALLSRLVENLPLPSKLVRFLFAKGDESMLEGMVERLIHKQEPTLRAAVAEEAQTNDRLGLVVMKALPRLRAALPGFVDDLRSSPTRPCDLLKEVE